MIQQAQIPQYNARANAMMGQVAQRIGGLGEVYQDAKFRDAMGGVTDTNSLLELYTMHPDKYDPNRVKQMQLQESEMADNAFFAKLEGAQTQEDALKVIKSDPKRYTNKIQEFMENLPSPKKDAMRKDLLEEGAYVNTGKFDQLPALFDKREAMVHASDLSPEDKQERLEDIAEDREFLAAGHEVYAERHRLSEEGVLGADNYKKLSAARGDVGAEKRAEGMAETNLALKKEELNKAIETVKQMTDSTGKVPPDQRFAATETLRKAYQSESKDFIQIDKHYQDLMNAKLTGIGGMNTILSFYKIKDPTSIVSTSELNAAMDSSGMTDSVKKTVLRLFEGGELTETARKNFKEEATSMWKSAKSEADKTRNRLGTLAKKSGLDPKDFMNPEREVEPEKDSTVSPKFDALFQKYK